VKAGGLNMNHTRRTLKVRTGVKAGGLKAHNHSRGALRVRTQVKAGALTANHSRRLASIA